MGEKRKKYGVVTMPRIVVKLKANTTIRLDSTNRFISIRNENVNKLNSLLSQNNIISIYPLFSSTTEKTPEARELKNFIGIELEDSQVAESLVNELRNLPYVEHAYVEPSTELA